MTNIFKLWNKKICLLIFMLPFLSFSCSVMGDYKFATVEEQFELASSVFYGRVKNVHEIIENNLATITLSNYRVFKSPYINNFRNKPRTLEISGFRSSAACGTGIPKKGDKIIVFVCPNRNKDDWILKTSFWRKRYWSLNQIAVFTGSILVNKNKKKLRTVRKLARKNSNFPLNLKCQKRETERDFPNITFDLPPSGDGPNIPADQFNFPPDPDGP